MKTPWRGSCQTRAATQVVPVGVRVVVDGAVFEELIVVGSITAAQASFFSRTRTARPARRRCRNAITLTPKYRAGGSLPATGLHDSQFSVILLSPMCRRGSGTVLLLGWHVETAKRSDVYYDPYDVELNFDPYPVFARLREEAPLYYNAEHDFYAVSRYRRRRRALRRPRDLHLRPRGGMLEIIKAGMEIPPGV